jgi:hypothetical protein
MGYWLVNTAGVGAIIVWTIGLSVFTAYVCMLHWIQTAPRDPVPAETAPQDEEITAAGAGGKEV